MTPAALKRPVHGQAVPAGLGAVCTVPLVLYFDAAVHDHPDPGGPCLLCRFRMDDAQLHPDQAGADGDGSINLGRNSLNTLEQVDDINCPGDIRQRRVALASEDGAAVGLTGTMS